MKYCTRCIIPHNRPHIDFDSDGDCNCAQQCDKQAIDWDARRAAFEAVVADAKKRTDTWSCIIPVSGGKDSTWQVLTCLEYGLKPLCVTWRPPGRTTLGQENLDNLISLGVDHIDFSINPEVEKKMTWEALLRHGSPAVPMHMAIFGIPLTMAVRFRVPLVVWGENSAFEYGGDELHRRGLELNHDWLRKYGCTFGTTSEDWLDVGLSRDDLRPYSWPTDDELASVPVRAVFLGAYFSWDPEKTHAVAAEHGFRARTDGPATGHYDYADIDDAFISVNHWLKWYKFGFTRSFDNLSLEIRNGRLTREQAIDILRRRGDETPHADIERFCAWLGITTDEFFKAIEPFRNPDVWARKNGTWMIDDFLVPDWSWT